MTPAEAELEEAEPMVLRSGNVRRVPVEYDRDPSGAFEALISCCNTFGAFSMPAESLLSTWQIEIVSVSCR
jgi:hypothetical protein